jgi:hypothetical protein
MKRSKRRLPIPQHEFGFTPDTFGLMLETTLDGERIARERAEAEHARQLAEKAQPALFAPKRTSPTKENHPYRLRAGDLVRYAGQPCNVVRVNDCAAVVAVKKPAREFTTLFGVRVRIQPKPALVRISPQSEITILNR